MLALVALGKTARARVMLPVSRIESLRAARWRTSSSFTAAAHSSSAASSDDDDDQGRRNPTSTSSASAVPVSHQRTLRVAVLGVPNAGKSTLVNVLTGAKVSAVSPKTNTTTTPCLGAFTLGRAQVLLLDTPGAVSAKEARGPAHARRIRAAWTSSEGCDAALLVVDAARQALRPDRRVLALAAALASSSRAAEALDSANRAREDLERIRRDVVVNEKLIEAAEARAAEADAAAATAAKVAARASGGFGASPPPGWRPPRETILVLNKIDAISSPGGSSSREEALGKVVDSLVRATATGDAADNDNDDGFWPEDEERGSSESPTPLPVTPFFDAIHALSATRAGSRAVRSLSADLASRGKAGTPWLLLPTDVSDRPARALAAEIVREKAFLRLRDELPYSVEVVERGWRERGAGDGRSSARDDDTKEEFLIEYGNPGSVVAEYDLLVSREPVRRMVVGRGGSVIGEIGISARKELEKLLDRKVHLYLTVRVAGRGRGGG